LLLRLSSRPLIGGSGLVFPVELRPFLFRRLVGPAITLTLTIALALLLGDDALAPLVLGRPPSQTITLTLSTRGLTLALAALLLRGAGWRSGLSA
jgi:hypothetical protein